MSENVRLRRIPELTVSCESCGRDFPVEVKELIDNTVKVSGKGTCPGCGGKGFEAWDSFLLYWKRVLSSDRLEVKVRLPNGWGKLEHAE